MKNASKQAPRHGGDPRDLPAPPPSLAMIDLATGVNPWSWPVSPPPTHCYNVLPYSCPQLQSAAASYYGVPDNTILATAGSQPVIQVLPRIVAPGRVLLADIAYQEHRYRWELAGHETYNFGCYSRAHIAQRIADEKIDYLVIISPNNPTGDMVCADDVRYWRSLLPAEGLVLIDQAFADAMSESDLSILAAEHGIVLLRSVGKFFGLPGLRLGFVIAQPSLLAELDTQLGPWAVCGSAQWLGRKALLDRQWQASMRSQLQLSAKRQGELLAQIFSPFFQQLVVTPLFVSLVIPLALADELQQRCYDQGLSVRVYKGGNIAYMRWGLARDYTLLATRLQMLCLDDLAA